MKKRRESEVTDIALERGRRLPATGENFRAYSVTAHRLGRTFVHSAVRDAMREAYATLARERPELRFIYAETGWPWGGRFAPHRTHRNGTSVDFLVPVRDTGGRVTELPTTVSNQFGYKIEFDAKGRFSSLTLDFEAVALHLLALDEAARIAGIGIRVVVFDLEYHPLLFATAAGKRLRERVRFNKSQPWVRHDEHYHVDFDVPCVALER